MTSLSRSEILAFDSAQAYIDYRIFESKHQFLCEGDTENCDALANDAESWDKHPTNVLKRGSGEYLCAHYYFKMAGASSEDEKTAWLERFKACCKANKIECNARLEGKILKEAVWFNNSEYHKKVIDIAAAVLSNRPAAPTRLKEDIDYWFNQMPDSQIISWKLEYDVAELNTKKSSDEEEKKVADTAEFG